MFRLDVQGKCETCCNTAKPNEIIKCETCQFSYHALCESADGKADGIAKKTQLDQHKQASYA